MTNEEWGLLYVGGLLICFASGWATGFILATFRRLLQKI